MAENWKVNEAVQVINEGGENLIDMGRRFPLATMQMGRLAGNIASDAIFNSFPDWMTMRKLETQLRSGIDEDAEEEVKTPAKAKAEKAEKAAPVKKAPVVKKEAAPDY